MTDRRAAGFALLELLLVVAILGSIGALAWPIYGQSAARAKLETSARLIQSELRLAREQALARGVSHGVAFSIGTGSYQVRRAGIVIRIGNLEEGVRFLATDLKDSSGRPQTGVDFSFDGSPSSSGTITLVEAGGRSVTLLLIEGTGHVVINGLGN